MKNVFIASAVASLIATAALAEEAAAPVATSPVGGSVALDVAKNAADDMVGTLTLGLSLDAGTIGTAGFALESVDGGDLAIDSWHIGTTLGMADVSFGDQGDLFVGNDFEIVGGDTIADPAEPGESLQISAGDAAIMIGITDMTADITDVQNLQGSYTLNTGGLSVTAVGDYNLDSEEWLLGSKTAMAVGDIAVGGLLTYGSELETVAYEASAGYGMFGAFVNGDADDALQNVGGGVYKTIAGLNVYAEGAYNIDAEEETVGAGISFNF